jgi:polyisoprenoid-binding protein YceI
MKIDTVADPARLGLAVLAFLFTTPTVGAAPKATQDLYRIERSQSRFVVETQTEGLSSMFDHDHLFRVGAFHGTVGLGPDAPSNASLELTVEARSLSVQDDLPAQVRAEIDDVVRTRTLQADKYPAISFDSRRVTATDRHDGSLDLEVTGKLRLHGVTREVMIPVRAWRQPDRIRVIGRFTIHQTDFGIKPIAFRGQVTVKDQVTLSFEMVATRVLRAVATTH